MPERKINDSVMLAMLDKGKKQAEVAQFFNVSPQAISDRLKKLRGGVIRNVVLEAAPKIVEKKINSVEQLQNINAITNQLLDQLIGKDQTISRMAKAVELFLEYEKDPTKENFRKIKGIILQVNQDKNTALKACQEIRGQLSLQLDIFKTLYDVEAVADFKREVLNAIGEIEPEIRSKIIQNLKAKRALRGDAQIA